MKTHLNILLVSYYQLIFYPGTLMVLEPPCEQYYIEEHLKPLLLPCFP
jgi:hypothetical protein